jgi:hypothetical protein
MREWCGEPSWCQCCPGAISRVGRDTLVRVSWRAPASSASTAIAQLVQHHLVAVVVPSDRAEALAFLERCRDGGQKKTCSLAVPPD